MSKLIKNVVTKSFHFILHFPDGRDEEITIDAESYQSAVYGLPRFADVGPYKYELLKK